VDAHAVRVVVAVIVRAFRILVRSVWLIEALECSFLYTSAFACYRVTWRFESGARVRSFPRAATTFVNGWRSTGCLLLISAIHEILRWKISCGGLTRMSRNRHRIPMNINHDHANNRFIIVPSMLPSSDIPFFQIISFPLSAPMPRVLACQCYPRRSPFIA